MWLAFLWPASLCDMGLCVWPMYWFPLVHFVHSSKYITLHVLQFVFLGVGKDFRLELEVTLSFLDMALQHLQPGVALPAECPPRLGVMGIVIG